MEYYEYADWIVWPEADIREYAREIAADRSLTLDQADYLERAMAQHAGHWPELRGHIGPEKMTPDLEAKYRSLGSDDEQILLKNRRMNAPYRPSNFSVEGRLKTVGRGLSRRTFRHAIRESPALKRKRLRDQRRRGKNPFTSMNPQIRNSSNRAMWVANCYPISGSHWITPSGDDAPYEGLIWYSRELEHAYYNARDQAWQDNIEAAMWHAFRAGSLSMELEIRLTHGSTYEKYEAVSLAQSDAARSRKTVSDNDRQCAYWRHRREGNKRIEAGRLAAAELGLSESSIRNAFPDGKYPAD